MTSETMQLIELNFKLHSKFQNFIFFRQGFENCSKLLKSNGELFIIFQYKTHALYSTYKKMNQIHKWRIYSEDYANFVPHFHYGQPESPLKNVIEQSGLLLLSHKFESNYHISLKKRSILGKYHFSNVYSIGFKFSKKKLDNSRKSCVNIYITCNKLC